ncbi:hypothetical protein PVL29_012870 [Vitis rotundifolia]|uniref:Smr domain-containing protein n=1 Tax=Vitis rotundifolia TaxID=103349 RepID=A0AA38ZKE8_VITRO|nr:hypothetical protein PVL29_012870 [Vitis rotundifolia]
MEFCHRFISIRTPSIIHRTRKPYISFCNSPESQRIRISETLHNETLKTLEWDSICRQLSAFTSTTMASAAARNGNVRLGRSRDESQKLLDQTTAAVLFSRPLDFSGIEDVSEIVDSAVGGELVTVGELCAVKRTLKSAREVLELLEDGERSERYSPLLEILRSCDFQIELEHKIGFCIDCNLSIILDRASEDLEIIRSERKRNMENLDLLLKKASTEIFQAGGIDRPLITKRRSRMCVGVRASHRHLLSDGVLLNVSSSGATYFMEPKVAVELNNMEVRLSNSQKAEENAILSLFTSEIARSEMEIKYLLDRIVEVDLAFARAAYARWMNGVCPSFSCGAPEGFESNGSDYALSVHIEGIQHPLLLESSLRNFPDVLTPQIASSVQLDKGNAVVPIDIQIGCGTRVVVISGPNTGGKTASMKTLGLASLMSKAGMYLPAKKHPRLPWFDMVLAEIGDHQSWEQNLSTFSGHISRVCKILEVASKESLVLIDEIGCGTDPSEGVALSASILEYLKDSVNLAVITTHYADLSCLKEKDAQFENAAMEFSLENLQPTYRILWGRTGDSNALKIAKSIGFDEKIIEHAQEWVERLMPDKQQQWKGLLYQSLMEERNRLEAQAQAASSLHSEIMDLYREIQEEAQDLDGREILLKAKETQQVQKELKTAKSQLQTVVQEFENQLRTANADNFNSLIKKSESAISSIVEAHCLSDDFFVAEKDSSSYKPQLGEQVNVKGLGGKLATVVEAPGDDDETVLVQYGNIRVRVKKSNIIAIPVSERNAGTSSVRPLRRQGQRRRILRNASDADKNEEVSYGPLVQTSKNTLDLRGMRVEEASHHLNMAISARESNSVLFVIHGMGTGVVKECAIEILRNHPRVAKFEQESPMNYGCTVAYIK